MVQRKWTRAQQDAISARDGSLLVSAAAGSGKTAVLVQRVIERLTDEKNPCDADRLLVVTFTTAAAAEMRERISARISELLEEDPNNSRLRRQQILLSRAHISTIHSFCNEIIRENFYKLDVPPDFRISEENEMTLLKDQAMQEVINELYEENSQEFINLVESFSASRDDKRLIQMIDELYKFVRSHPFPEKWFSDKLEMYNNVSDIASTQWGKIIFKYAKSAVQYCISLTRNSLEMMLEDEKINEKYHPMYMDDLSNFNALIKTLETDNWDAAYEMIVGFEFKKLGVLRGYSDDPLKTRVSDNRDESKEIIKKLKGLFIYNEAQCRSDINQLYPIINKLFDATMRFSKRLDELKADKHIADFGDLEHWTIRLLVNSTDKGFERTEEAIEISEKFDEVMVDEYQDTNEAQDMIFRAISKNEENLFVVGDVKQSIYRFRQAMPEIFLRRKESYEKYDRERNNYPARVVLDKNFRSRKGVTDAVNFVFKQLMSVDMGEMEYNEEEELVAGADYDDRNIPDISLHIIDMSRFEEDDMDIVESEHIANIISKMIKSGHTIKDGERQRPVTYKDFCVLVRSSTKHAPVYAKQLQLFGIPAKTDTAGSFFGTLEVAVMLSMLRVIDNPIQDIPLLSVLMSPIYGFTPDDISDIRLAEKKGPLYFAVKKCADNGDNRCAEFLLHLEEYRRLASTLSSDMLINCIYDKTGYFAMVKAMKDGELRVANLRKLLEYSRGYEKSGYKGLSGFIRFIDKLEEQKSDLDSASTVSESANVVRVMSIHRSKGLEFPICILANCARKFNKDKLLLHPTLGLGVKLRDEDGIRQYTTVPREAVLLELERAGMSEELRVLYVAMTRAKENLIMLTSLKNPEKTIGQISAKLADLPSISPYIVRSATSFSDWLIACAIRHPSGKKLREIANTDSGIMLTQGENWDIELIYPEQAEQQQEDFEKENKAMYSEEILRKIKERIGFKYIASELESIPSKLAASELAIKNSTVDYSATSRPAFMTGSKLTPAEKGTALHAYMQFADYELAQRDAEEHLRYLEEKGFLSEEQAKAVNIESINKFFSSELMQRISMSKNVMREYRFTVEMKAGELNKLLPEHLRDETVILQGAIDCAFEEDGELVVVDYKTDRTKSEEDIISRYSKQLELYKNALEKCTGMKVKECLLYSFAFGKTISLDGV